MRAYKRSAANKAYARMRYAVWSTPLHQAGGAVARATHWPHPPRRGRDGLERIRFENRLTDTHGFPAIILHDGNEFVKRFTDNAYIFFVLYEKGERVA